MRWWTREKGRVLNCPTCREAQRVTVSRVRQINFEVQQKEQQECRATQEDRHSSQSQLSFGGSWWFWPVVIGGGGCWFLVVVLGGGGWWSLEVTLSVAWCSRCCVAQTNPHHVF